ncbi:hypothetical protein BDY21DRAFT_289406 [Lineolata rhizophorae]|uniref:Ca3427-like PBP 2 domain-containing protein n=1 Tax=Lineolata rhizophorae TaxID=578093 RepID=A0A6A6NUZ9_9PEZI|nr:hypothetical protein BDY21DRAFT_289406 [Lineolata rhizophorae]
MARPLSTLRVGFVPEHFSTPLHFAVRHHGLRASLVPFPSGTGHMVKALRGDEIDVGIGLTEGWVAAAGEEVAAAREKGEKEERGIKLVGTYVETPLCWGISTGATREDVCGVEDLKGKGIGVSRIGSGSYIMGFVLADQQGWLSLPSQISSSEPPPPPFNVKVLSTFQNLRDAVNARAADFFMWEHFTTKRYWDSGEIKRIGEIYTPWSSWKIATTTALLTAPESKRLLEDLFAKLDMGTSEFKEKGGADGGEVVKFIAGEMDYSEEDAREWYKGVRFADKVEGVDEGVIGRTIEILRKAGVVRAEKFGPDDVIAMKRK